MDNIFEKFKDLKVLVIGDVMLDKYYFTDVNRISPEAPIPIAKYSSEKNVLGGAANVALNLSNLGVETYLIGTIGIDANGKIFQDLLRENKIKFCPILTTSQTTTKIRIVSKSNQLLRLDFENEIHPKGNDEILKEVKTIIEKVDLIIVSDYRKGVVSKELISYLSNVDKYVSIDTKPSSYLDFSNFNLVKPNFMEAKGIAKALGNNKEYTNDDKSIEELGIFLKQKLNSNILITRSEKGVSYISEKTYHKPINISKVYDVTGAGDTSIAIFTILNYLKYDVEKSLDVMNAAAKVTVSNLGTYAPTINEIKKSLFMSEEKNIFDSHEVDLLKEILDKKNKKIVFTNGCFDIVHKGHIEYLNQAKKLGDILIIGLNSDISVKKLKGENRPIIDEESRAFLLSNLKCVDYVIIFDENTPENIISKIKPNIHVKGGDYKEEDLSEAKIVKSYGGKVKIIKLEEGFSTTNIVNKIKNN